MKGLEQIVADNTKAAHNRKKIVAVTGKKVDSCTMMVKHWDLRAAKFNPEIRTRRGSLKRLLESMTEGGFWTYRPIICDRNGTIIDGHRRWSAAGLLGITDVPVCVLDGDADKLWGEINSGTMPISGAQVVQAKQAGLKRTPKLFKAQVDRIVDLMGKAGIDLLASRGMGPNVLATAERIGRYCTMTTDRDFIVTTIRWLANHKAATQIVVRAMRDQVAPSKIYRAIKDDRDLVATYE